MGESRRSAEFQKSPAPVVCARPAPKDLAAMQINDAAQIATPSAAPIGGTLCIGPRAEPLENVLRCSAAPPDPRPLRTRARQSRSAWMHQMWSPWGHIERILDQVHNTCRITSDQTQRPPPLVEHGIPDPFMLGKHTAHPAQMTAETVPAAATRMQRDRGARSGGRENNRSSTYSAGPTPPTAPLRPPAALESAALHQQLLAAGHQRQGGLQLVEASRENRRI